MYKVLVPVVSMLFLAGCTAAGNTESFSKNNVVERRFSALSTACFSEKQQRLSAADSVMELIVYKMKNDGSDSNVLQAGNRLYKLTGRFYRNNIDSRQCVKEVNVIKNYYDLSYRS